MSFTITSEISYQSKKICTTVSLLRWLVRGGLRGFKEGETEEGKGTLTALRPISTQGGKPHES